MAKIDEISEEIQKLVTLDLDKVEPEFADIDPDKPILIIWRIEKLKLIKWPQLNYGTFFEGDSFLVLCIKSSDEKNAHIWTGKESTKDEISYVSYKVLQLDKKFENNLEIYYESQEKESELFKSYFDFFTVVKGGVDANLENFESKQYKARLFHVHSVGAKFQSRQITINKNNLDSGDVYLLDTGIKVFIWTGYKSNSFEKFHIGCLAKRIRDLRENKITIINVYEDSKDDIDLKNKEEFEEFMKKYEEEEDFTKKESIYDGGKKMMKLSDEKGKFEMTDVPFGKNSLKTEDSFLIDRGDALVIWIGKKASAKEKKYARFYANRYITQAKRSSKLPIYVTTEGKHSKEFEKCFN